MCRPLNRSVSVLVTSVSLSINLYSEDILPASKPIVNVILFDFSVITAKVRRVNHLRRENKFS